MEDMLTYMWIDRMEDVWTDRWKMYGQTDGRYTDRQTDRWKIDGQTFRQMDARQTDTWTDGR